MEITFNSKYKEWGDNRSYENMITFFTPTYNRANLFPRAYDCLLRQTNNHYVWIIVNDGSNDNTNEVVKELLDKNEIPILFISKENGGKHSAFEAAFNEADTEYFMCMDDDDIYYPNAVEVFLNEWQAIKEEGKLSEIGAIRALTQESDGRIVSKKAFDKTLLGTHIDQTTLESNLIKGEYFENWTCYRTEALRSIDLFPKNYWMHEQHKFYSEVIWQSRFAREYKCRYLFVVLREYRHDTETSILRGNKSKQHYIDMFINTMISLEEQLDYYWKSPKQLLKMLMIVVILRNKLKINFCQLIRNTNSPLLKIMYCVLSPVSFFAVHPKINL